MASSRHADLKKQYDENPDWWVVMCINRWSELRWSVTKSPSWWDDWDYRLDKSDKHPDNLKPDVAKEKQMTMKLTEQGRQALRWLLEGKQVEYRIDSVYIWVDLQGNNVLDAFCGDDVSFRIAKPKLKLVDMSKLPKGTMTDHGEVVHNKFGAISCYFVGDLNLSHPKAQKIRITEQTEFTFWQGGECPVPDGLRFEVKTRGGASFGCLKPSGLRWSHETEPTDIIGYRIIAVADGWTDDPEQAQ
jgi:NOL1/NOP2/fmu family ribosome biogenesis protein